ncbi:Site-specific DNA recombinase [Nitrosomonas ureae]|uniref:Site-specific DNA recombinase n=2 Tax=Nitrosomonas ureae TaxID=44577 RepID=A0A1H9EGU0_9PROT|nr:Site-specific DNA recombinase [Nitrosomonas ureae]
MAVIGYARVSTEEQNLDLQIDALKAAGCDRIFEDHGISAIVKKRSGFERAMKALKNGDTFVIWKLDRAFRSLHHALDMLEMFELRQIAFRSLTNQIDTTTPEGKFMYHIRFAFAELERNLISERTRAGMMAAKKRGKHVGRPYALSIEQIAAIRKKLCSDPKMTVRAVSEEMGVCMHTLYRALRRTG